MRSLGPVAGIGPVRWWKLVGLAGIAGVAATGAVIARSERRRRAYTPEEVRSRLHERHAQAQAADVGQPPSISASRPDRNSRSAPFAFRRNASR
jgi:hypothetical protein